MAEQRFIRLATPEEAARWQPVPEGFQVVVYEEGPEWQVLEEDPQRETFRSCRGAGWRNTCRAEPAVTLSRHDRRSGERRWAYCAAHMYGRWIEDGRVVGCRLARVEPGGTPNRQEE